MTSRNCITSPDIKQLNIFDRIFLFLIFGAQLRSLCLLFCLLRCLPTLANSARCSSAGSIPTNLRAESCRACNGTTEGTGCCISCLHDSGVIGRVPLGVDGFVLNRGEEARRELFEAERGITVVGVTYGIARLVEDRFGRPS